MSWQPLLDGELAMRARSTIEEIERDLATRTIESPTLEGGHAGIALLHGYRALELAQAGRDEAAEAASDRAMGSLQAALERLGDVSYPYLFFGFAGIAFAIQHLAAVVGDNEETLAQLDDLVTQQLAGTPYEWELMNGAAGLGVYGLERRTDTMVARAVDHLVSLAKRDGEHVTWDAYYRDERPHWSLGISHGVAGVIGFLAEVVAASGSAAPVARSLLPGAISWLRTHERFDRVPRFPQVLGLVEGQPGHPGNAEGWCYGDPSTAIVLARAGSVLGDSAIVSHAHALALAAARRTTDETASIPYDHTFCHGDIGMAHLFHRLGLAFRDAELLATARRWYTRAIDRYDATTFSAIEPGLRAGTSGFALALLAATSPIEPAWDRIFLVALPAGSCLGGSRLEHHVERVQ